MNNKHIYLIRHGQTDYNLNGIVQGSGVDTSLNATGRMQAQAFYETYKDIPFDKIYASALKRTVETISPFLEKGIPMQQLEGLNEFSWGCKEGLSLTDENHHQEYLRVTTDWQNGIYQTCIEGGENPLQVQARQLKAFEIIMANSNEETILICMHGRAMRLLLCTLLNYDISCMDTFAHNNTGLYRLVYTGSMYQVLTFNDLQHLNTDVKDFLNK